MDYTEISTYVASREPASRYRHSLETAGVCRELAKRFSVDTDTVFVAALWHDLARDWSDGDLLMFVESHDLNVLHTEMQTPMLLHGIVAAELFVESPFSRWFDDNGKDAIWSAIRWHTTGHPDMGLPGYILFIADYIEPGRTHLTEGERLEILQLSSLEDMMIHILDRQFAYFRSKSISYEGPAVSLYSSLQGDDD